MSAQHQQQSTKTSTRTISDSYNTSHTVNEVFDNAGNSNVYVNSEEPADNAPPPTGNKNLLIAGGVIAAALLLAKK